jgi:hypothetical protein
MSLSAGLLLALSAAGGATASPSKSQDSGQPQVATTTVSSATTTVSSATTAGYWTPERMRAAIPGDVLAEKAVARQNSKGTNSGPSVDEKGSSTKIAGTSGKGSKTTPLHKDELPVNHIGKVFFTLGGANYVCSGNSVVSTNRSTVSTAGHCVNEGPGAFATNFVFVPQYKDGAAPLGKWPAKALFTPTEWSRDGNMQYDTGFAVVSQLNGQSLADAAGASGVAFNEARGLTYKSYGYPAAAPFTGQTLVSCTGKSAKDVINPQFDTQGIPCDMTGGSSGGPWFIGSDATGFQNSINSYGYGTRSTTMFGPYWGTVIQQAYNSASAAK